MEVLHPRCAGLDVHSRRVNACVRIAAGRKATAEHREFATTTAGLLALAAWLTEAGCTHVAMEATGVYWKPVWHILEDESSLTGVGPIPWTGQRLSGSDIAAELFLGVAACVMSLDPVSAL